MNGFKVRFACLKLITLIMILRIQMIHGMLCYFYLFIIWNNYEVYIEYGIWQNICVDDIGITMY